MKRITCTLVILLLAYSTRTHRQRVCVCVRLCVARAMWQHPNKNYIYNNNKKRLKNAVRRQKLQEQQTTAAAATAAMPSAAPRHTGKRIILNTDTFANKTEKIADIERENKYTQSLALTLFRRSRHHLSGSQADRKCWKMKENNKMAKQTNYKSVHRHLLWFSNTMPFLDTPSPVSTLPHERDLYAPRNYTECT